MTEGEVSLSQGGGGGGDSVCVIYGFVIEAPKVYTEANGTVCLPYNYDIIRVKTLLSLITSESVLCTTANVPSLLL